MMRCDAEWLGRTLAELKPEELSPLLNLGASTKHFRQVEQPYIDKLVFRPLEARGVRVIHSDLKAAEGVDLVGDVFDNADFARLQAAKPRSVICTHMFEHAVNSLWMPIRPSRMGRAAPSYFPLQFNWRVL